MNLQKKLDRSWWLLFYLHFFWVFVNSGFKLFRRDCFNNFMINAQHMKSPTNFDWWFKIQPAPNINDTHVQPTRVYFIFTHQDMPGRYSPGNPQVSHGTQRGRSSPLVRRNCVDGCGSLWHNSASSSTTSPMMTNRRRPLSPPASSGVPQQVLKRKVGKWDVKVKEKWLPG